MNSWTVIVHCYSDKLTLLITYTSVPSIFQFEKPYTGGNGELVSSKDSANYSNKEIFSNHSESVILPQSLKVALFKERKRIKI